MASNYLVAIQPRTLLQARSDVSSHGIRSASGTLLNSLRKLRSVELLYHLMLSPVYYLLTLILMNSHLRICLLRTHLVTLTRLENGGVAKEYLLTLLIQPVAGNGRRCLRKMLLKKELLLSGMTTVSTIVSLIKMRKLTSMARVQPLVHPEVFKLTLCAR